MKKLCMLIVAFIAMFCFSNVFAQKCTCNDCKGSGWITKSGNCSFCNNGYKACPRCNSSGSERCGSCMGSGTVNVKCRTCSGTGRVNNEKCTQCNGSGSVNETCTRCSGQGKYSCTRCGGSGKEVCTQCNGTGKKEWNYPCETCHQTGRVNCK